MASEPILRRLRAIGGLTSRLDIPNQTVVLALQPLLTSVARIIVQLGGSAAGTRRALNFIAGTNVTISAADDAANERINITIDSSGGGGGGIAGPGSSTDNAVTRWDGTAGAAVQNSLVTISDTGSISLPALQTVDGRDVSVDGTTLDTLNAASVAAGTGLTGGGLLNTSPSLTVTYGSAAGTAAEGNDTRLSDARTPLTHAATHRAGASDPVEAGIIRTGSTNLTVGAITDGQALVRSGTTIISAAVGTGNVVGPGSATDNAITRYDGTTGALVQDSLVTVSDTGSIALPALQTIDGRDVSVDGTVLDTLNAASVTAGTGLTGGGVLNTSPSLAVSFGSSAGTVTQGNDARLSDARTPLTHATSHRSGGSDPVEAGIIRTGTTNLTVGAIVDGQALIRSGTTVISAAVGTGDVVGPASATDNAIARYDATTGRLIQNSLVTVSDTGSIALPALQTVDGRDVSVDGTTLDTLNSASITAGTGLTGGGALNTSPTVSVSFGSSAGTVTQGDDARLSDARTPLTHALSHRAGGSDPVEAGIIRTGTTNLIVSTITDGQYLLRSGTTIISGGGGGGGGDLLAANNLSDVLSTATSRTNLGVAFGTGTGTLTFGAAPGTNVVFTTITGQAGIEAGSSIRCYFGSDSTATHNEDEHRFLAQYIALVPSAPSAGTGFTVWATTELRLTGTVQFRWEWRQ